jgi:hypothetical protein
MGAAIELEIIRDTQEGSNLTDRIVREVGKPVLTRYAPANLVGCSLLHRDGAWRDHDASSRWERRWCDGDRGSMLREAGLLENQNDRS